MDNDDGGVARICTKELLASRFSGQYPGTTQKFLIKGSRSRDFREEMYRKKETTDQRWRPNTSDKEKSSTRQSVKAGSVSVQRSWACDRAYILSGYIHKASF